MTPNEKTLADNMHKALGVQQSGENASIESQAVDWLSDYDQQRKPLGIQCFRIKKGTVCLSGYPYLWTQFAERAFVFGSLEDANTFILTFGGISRIPMRVVEIRSHSPVTNPQDFTAPCGCVIRFDNDGLIRLQHCNLHANAAESLKALKSLLKYAVAISIRGDNVEKRAARLAIKKSEGKL